MRRFRSSSQHSRSGWVARNEGLEYYRIVESNDGQETWWYEIVVTNENDPMIATAKFVLNGDKQTEAFLVSLGVTEEGIATNRQTSDGRVPIYTFHHRLG